MKWPSLWSSLLTLGFTHAVADAITGFSAGQIFHLVSSSQAIMIILGYNLIGFGLQPLFGWIIDRVEKRAQGMILGFALIGLGLILLPQSLFAAFVCMAIGSGLFHVGAGALAGLLTPNKTIGAAFFTAPGVVGLSLGTVAGLLSLPIERGLFLAMIVGLVGLIQSDYDVSSLLQKNVFSKQSNVLLTAFIFLLIGGTAARSFAWMTIGSMYFGWKAILELGIAAGMGKLFGGIAADRLGRVPVIWGSLFLACAALATGVWPLILLGAFFLQVSTPIILATFVQRMPKYASLAAGCVLGLGIVLGGVLFQLQRPGAMALSVIFIGAGMLVGGMFLIEKSGVR